MTKEQDVKQRAINIKKIRLDKERDVFMKLGGKLKAYFFTGILVTAPVMITFYLAYKLIIFIDVSVNRLLPPQFKPDSFLPFTIPGLGIIILVVSLIVIGMFAAGFMGKFFLRLGEWIVYKMPVVSSVYSILKQIFETFLSNKSNAFKQVVLLEYPRKGLWILGFVSTDTGGEVKKHLKTEMINVFIPTTPNPTSGFLIFVPKTDVTVLEMSVEDGIKFVISGGIVAPEEHKKSKKKF